LFVNCLEFGFIYSCGVNDQGQLGHGDLQIRSTLTQIKAHRFSTLFCGSLSNHWFGVTNKGLMCVGSNNRGQLMMGDTLDRKEPCQVHIAAKVIDMGLGAEHTVVIIDRSASWLSNMQAFRDIIIECCESW
jgi:alpha-tubulin suppressor-like RCC1 family protein